MRQQAQTKCFKVVDALRREIVEGEYGPGERLPNRLQIKERFGVAMLTVQKALDSLAADGFIRSQTRNGTFVVDNPPHLCNYGLVVPAGGLWSRYYTAMREAAKYINENSENIHLVEYTISGKANSPEGMQRLLADVKSRKVAGLLFMGRFDDYDLSEVLNAAAPDVPVVAAAGNTQINAPKVSGDPSLFINRAVDYLESKGCRRVAHICTEMPSPEDESEDLEKRIYDSGLEVRPYWIQYVPAGASFRSAARIVQLLVRLNDDDRPDGLIVHDDNLVEFVIEGLTKEGVKVPDDLVVVSLWNYPPKRNRPTPIKYLGPDLREVLKREIELLNMQRSGQKPPELTMGSPLFEEEVKADVTVVNELAALR